MQLARIVAAVLLLLSCSLALAENAAAARSYNVLLDADNNATTGCNVSLRDQGASDTFFGAEHILTATESNYAITAVHQKNCQDGVFGSSTLIDGTATAVPPTKDGGLAIQLAIAKDVLGGSANETMRLAFLAGPLADVLQSVDGTSAGSPILLQFTGLTVGLPAMSLIAQIVVVLVMMAIAMRFARRRSSAAVVMLVAGFVVAGISLAQITGSSDLSSWTGPAIAIDLTGDSVGDDRELEIRSAYAQEESTRIVFRIDVEATPPDLSDDGTQYALVTTAPVQAGHLKQQIRAAFGVDVFLRDQFADDQTVESGTLSSTTIDGLTRAAGIETWTIRGPEDDPEHALRLPVSGAVQEGDDPSPCPSCTGDMDDGWPGTTGLPEPMAGPLEPPEPDGTSTDKPYVRDLSDPAIDAQQTPPADAPDVGQHLRVLLSVSEVTDGVTPLVAAIASGDAFQVKAPPIPPVGSILCVTRSTAVAGNEGVLDIHVVFDPFIARSYDPPAPLTGSHGSEPVDLANVSCPVTVSPDTADGEPGLSMVSLEIWRVADPLPLQTPDPRNLDGDVLTPAYFLANQARLHLLGQVANTALLNLVPTATSSARIASFAPAAAPATVTQIHSSGSRASKFNFVIIGDGFANTTAAQNVFNNYVANTVISQFFALDIHPEVLNAINIFRINTFSTQNSVTLVDANGNVTTAADTALSYRYSGIWPRCWMEPGPNTQTLLNAVITALVPEADGIAVVLNNGGPGGCARSGHFAVTRSSPATTFAHEFGHFFGGLGDEYFCPAATATCLNYTGNARSEQNLTISTSGIGVKWNQWIPSWRPTPTLPVHVVSGVTDVGIFAGATTGSLQWWTGMYRPSNNARMSSNAPPHNPVGYKAIRDIAYTQQEGDFRETAAGDFDGDGRTDLVMVDDRQLSLFEAEDRNVGAIDPVSGNLPRNVTGVLDPTFFVTDILRNAAATRSWEFRKNDILLPADFDGDGSDDLYVVNLVDWVVPYLVMLQSTGNGFEPIRRYDLALPGWGDMRANDQFYVGDFSGDGSVDLMVYNGLDWNIPYFLLLRSDGNRLVASRRYDQYLPGWEMGRHEKFFVGNFDGDLQSRADVIAFNTSDWNQVHLQVQVSTGAALSLQDRRYGNIGGFWTMRGGDKLYPLDLNDDGADDLAIWNGENWNRPYLGLIASVDGGFLSGVQRYDDHANLADNPIPGWGMRRADRHAVSDFDGDGDDDLVVLNTENWGTEYLGMLRVTGGNQLTGTWQNDWVGAWNLGSVDSFHVADFIGAGGWEDLFIYNQQWFGLLRSQGSQYSLEAIYPKWIQNHRYHDFGLW